MGDTYGKRETTGPQIYLPCEACRDFQRARSRALDRQVVLTWPPGRRPQGCTCKQVRRDRDG
ncbi:hypothetical protein BCD48_21715 [Pseudofrankia sp. BMG5.36]|nr:hypothetical protein BCD48_21715 [Pseudofrankia sp. BMG5.36]